MPTYWVGDSALCTKASSILMSEYNVYVQDINYPTVSYGEECLRVIPTPLHTDEMKMQFVNSLGIVWQQLGLPFMKPVEACSKFF